MTIKKQFNQAKSGQYGYITIFMASFLAIVLSPYAIAEANALVVTNDDFISCGKLNWGEKTWQNSGAPSPHVLYGRNTSCAAVQPAICSPGGVDCWTNYARLTSNNPGTSGGNSGWAAVIEGKDPWNWCDQASPGATGCVNFGGSTNRNSKLYGSDGNYVLAADKAFQLGAVSYWFSDATSKPATGSSGMKAWVLGNLWLAKTTEAKISCAGNSVYPTVIVLDFSFAKLKQSGSVWAYDTAGDQDSSAPHVQYSKAFYDNPSCAGQTVYHFSVVLDSTCAVNANTWCSVSPQSISSYINSAISYNYPPLVGSTPTKQPGGTSSNYKVADIEAGVETWGPGGSANRGTTKAAFSKVTLQY